MAIQRMSLGSGCRSCQDKGSRKLVKTDDRGQRIFGVGGILSMICIDFFSISDVHDQIMEEEYRV